MSRIGRSLTELMKLVPPPDDPVDVGDARAWAKIQTKLGLQFPADFRAYCDAYGSGAIFDPGRLSITIHSPLCEIYDKAFESHCSVFREMKEFEGDEFVPYEIYPQSPGLLPWASDDNGNSVLWLTSGAPKDWTTVFNPRGGYKEWYEYSEPMTGFLVKAIRHQLDPLPWPDPFFTGPVAPVFVRRGDPGRYRR
ncbi:MAG: SMI1/KNR4 family protein [Planctomycetes bacterium]|nr:SMI1/KNR4 family protein [Planctomycetota bacterium]